MSRATQVFQLSVSAEKHAEESMFDDCAFDVTEQTVQEPKRPDVARDSRDEIDIHRSIHGELVDVDSIIGPRLFHGGGVVANV